MGLLQLLIGKPLQNLVKVILTNYWLFFLLSLGIGGVIIVILEAKEKEPDVKRDFILLLGIIGIFLFVTIVLPYLLGMTFGCEADLEVGVHNPLLGSPEIINMKLTDFRSAGPTSLIVGGAPSLLFEEQIKGDVTVYCDNNIVDESGFTMGVTPGFSGSKSMKISGLEPGERCSVSVNIGTDRRTQSYRIPSQCG